MRKRSLLFISIIVMLSFTMPSVSYAAGKESFLTKIGSFWKTLLEYPARVTEESASVLADTAESGVKVVTGEIKKIAAVTTGDTAKAPELITEPIKGSADTVVKAVEGIANIPSEAAKDPETPKDKAPDTVAVTENK